MMNPILTIGIPTYNRPENIQRTVRALLPQLNDKVVLEVRDNCSNKPVVDLFTEEEKTKFTIVRNLANIGGDANIVGCIYHAKTKWVWTLGDDDTPNEDAVKTILYYLETFPEELYFKFGSIVDKETHDLHDLAELCKIRYFYSNLLFISNSVYNRDKLYNNIVDYYTNISFMNGQVVFLLKHLEKKQERCMFISKMILLEHGMEIGWNYNMVIKRSLFMMELFPSQKKMFDKTIYAGMAFSYYHALFFSQRMAKRERVELFIYLLKRIGFMNTIKYNHNVITQFLLKTIVPSFLYSRIKTILRTKYYEEKSSS